MTSMRQQEQHRYREWLLFLRLIQRKTPEHLQLHLIVNSFAAHSARVRLPIATGQMDSEWNTASR